jgi:hypothetical protein
MQKKECKHKPRDCEYGKKKNGECRKKQRACPWGRKYDDGNDCRKECPDKNKCEKDWKGGCKKDDYGIDIPKPDVPLPDWSPPDWH